MQNSAKKKILKKGAKKKIEKLEKNNLKVITFKKYYQNFFYIKFCQILQKILSNLFKIMTLTPVYPRIADIGDLLNLGLQPQLVKKLLIL